MLTNRVYLVCEPPPSNSGKWALLKVAKAQKKGVPTKHARNPVGHCYILLLGGGHTQGIAISFFSEQQQPDQRKNLEEK